MITVFKKFDKMYGGYDYVEVDFENKVFQSGCSRSHSGHFKGESIHVEVKAKRDITSVIQLLSQNKEYTHV